MFNRIVRLLMLNLRALKADTEILYIYLRYMVHFKDIANYKHSLSNEIHCSALNDIVRRKQFHGMLILELVALLHASTSVDDKNAFEGHE